AFFFGLAAVRAGDFFVPAFGFAMSAPTLGLGPRSRRREHTLDLGDEGIRHARLRDERVAARRLRSLGVARERMARERDDGDLPRLVVGLEPARRLPAVHAGEREVHEDEIGEQLLRLLDRLVAVA